MTDKEHTLERAIRGLKFFYPEMFFQISGSIEQANLEGIYVFTRKPEETLRLKCYGICLSTGIYYPTCKGEPVYWRVVKCADPDFALLIGQVMLGEQVYAHEALTNLYGICELRNAAEHEKAFDAFVRECAKRRRWEVFELADGRACGFLGQGKKFDFGL